MTTGIMLCARQHFVMLERMNLILERHVIGGRLHVSHGVKKKMCHWFSTKKRSSSGLTSLAHRPETLLACGAPQDLASLTYKPSSADASPTILECIFSRIRPHFDYEPTTAIPVVNRMASPLTASPELWAGTERRRFQSSNSRRAKKPGTRP